MDFDDTPREAAFRSEARAWLDARAPAKGSPEDFSGGYLEGTADAVETPIGLLPAAGSLDVDGLDIPDEDLAEVVGYKEQEWRDEVPRIGRWFDTFGWRLPREMVDELVNLEIALGTRGTTAE